jgi:hypothetical protein
VIWTLGSTHRVAGEEERNDISKMYVDGWPQIGRRREA